MTQITTHVLDVARGKPAEGLPVTLERSDGAGEWEIVWSGETDFDGRVKNVLPFGDRRLSAAVYRLTFDTGIYFSARSESSFYPIVTIVFDVRDPMQNYHVPLLLSPFGYSTYRGS